MASESEEELLDLSDHESEKRVESTNHSLTSNVNTQRLQAPKLLTNNYSDESDADDNVAISQGTSSSVPIEIELDSEGDNEGTEQETNSTLGGVYSLRRRRSEINYKDMAQNSEDEDDKVPSHSKSKRPKKDRIDLTALLKKDAKSIKQLNKFIKKPQLSEELQSWTLQTHVFKNGCQNDLDIQDEEHFQKVNEFVEKCAKHLDHLAFTCVHPPGMYPAYWPRILNLLESIFKHAKLLKKVTIKYSKASKSDHQVKDVLEAIKKSGQKSMNSLRLVGFNVHENGCYLITKEEFDIILNLSQIKWSSIELGNALWEDIGSEAIETFLEANQDTLEKFVVHGGFKGKVSSSSASFPDKSRFTIKFPRAMPSLRCLQFCPKYTFQSDPIETKNPSSKRWREIRLDEEIDDEKEQIPLKILLSLEATNFNKLEKVVLGNLVELSECGFSFLRNLKAFRCGSRYDLILRFPKAENQRLDRISNMQDLQLPDGLKDPLFVKQIGKFFPHLKRVWISLPSVAVLRTFFKTFEHSEKLEELYLKTQFDFETTMESCLLPEITLNNALSLLSKSVLDTLKEYKHCADYVRYHNIELPLLEEGDLADLRGENSAGISSLKSLKVLDLEHIPRKLMLPNPDDERKWFDHNFKFLTTTFGFKLYPFSKKCHQEILKMDLKEYHWRNLDIPSNVTSQFGAAGYVSMNIISSGEEDNEDLFTPILSQRQSKGNEERKSGVKVAVKPSMLIPNHFNKNKQEAE